MNPLKRLMLRAPIGLYRIGLGGLLGKRFLLLEHTGRKSGLPRRAVLEVVEISDARTPVVVSGYGPQSDWCRNVSANPSVAYTLGRNRVHATAQRLGNAEAVAVFERYRINHPRAAKVIGERIGVPLVDDPGTAAQRLPLFHLVAESS